MDQRAGQAHAASDQRPIDLYDARRKLGRDIRVRHDMVSAIVEDEVREQVVFLVPVADDLVAEAEKQCQAAADLPVVLHEVAKSFE